MIFGGRRIILHCHRKKHDQKSEMIISPVMQFEPGGNRDVIQLAPPATIRVCRWGEPDSERDSFGDTTR